MADSNKIAIAILAAGESSRMHGLKQLLPWGDTTLLGRAINAGLESNTPNVYVVLGSKAKKIKSRFTDSKVQWLFNAQWKKGMGSSIAHAVENIVSSDLSYRGILIMLCDQPLITADYLNKLIQTFGHGNYGIVATKYGDRAGVPAIFDKKYFDELKNLREDTGAKGIISQNIVDTIIIDGEEKTTDIDTKADYDRIGKG